MADTIEQVTISDALRQRFEQETTENPIVVYMKGTPSFPQCGFSAGAVECFKRLGAAFTYVDVLENEEVWEGIKVFSGWPTIPQVFVGGKLIGGCDITQELYLSGELEKLVEEAVQAKGSG